MTAESLINLILLFFAYAFLGWCIEVTLKYFQFHRFINRGLSQSRSKGFHHWNPLSVQHSWFRLFYAASLSI